MEFVKILPLWEGASYKQEILSDEVEAWAVSFITELSTTNCSYKKPAIDFHYMMKGHPKHSTECRCVRKSIGIMPDGTVTSCFWAIDDSTGIVDPKYLLGSVKQHTLLELLQGDKAAYWTSCAHNCELSVA